MQNTRLKGTHFEVEKYSAVLENGRLGNTLHDFIKSPQAQVLFQPEQPKTISGLMQSIALYNDLSAQNKKFI